MKPGIKVIKLIALHFELMLVAPRRGKFVVGKLASLHCSLYNYGQYKFPHDGATGVPCEVTTSASAY